MISKNQYAQMTQDFCSAARRKNGRIASYTTVFATPQMDKKTSQVGIFFAGNHLKLKKFVTLWSVPEADNRTLIQKALGVGIAQDGLADNHVYTVISMKQAAHGVWMVNLRNPWGTNLNVGEGKDAKSALISVSLDLLVTTGGLESFRVSDRRIR